MHRAYRISAACACSERLGSLLAVDDTLDSSRGEQRIVEYYMPWNFPTNHAMPMLSGEVATLFVPP